MNGRVVSLERNVNTDLRHGHAEVERPDLEGAMEWILRLSELEAQHVYWNCTVSYVEYIYACVPKNKYPRPWRGRGNFQEEISTRHVSPCPYSTPMMPHKRGFEKC